MKEIDYETIDKCAHITLNRPDRHNALTLPMQELLCEALWEADNNIGVHCIVLKGAGPSFCSGYDLGGSPSDTSNAPFSSPGNEYRRHKKIDDDAWQLEKAQRYRMALFDIHKPVIAQVHGYCLAGGTDIALLSDIVIAADDALFGFPPARDLGSLPNQMWVYNVGPQWAKRLLMTGDQISGKDAHQIGLVMKSVPVEVLADEVDHLASRLAKIDPDLLSANKRSVNLSLELMGARTMQRLAAEIDARAHNSDAANGFRQSVRENGLKETLRARDSAFGDNRVRFNTPDAKATTSQHAD